MSLDRKAFVDALSAFKPWIIVTGVLLFVALSVFSFDQFYSEHIRQTWATIASTEEQRITDDIQSHFEAYVQETADTTQRIAQLAEVLETLRDTLPAPSSTLFGSLIAHSNPDISVEVYDRSKRLIGWAGDRGPELDRNLLTTRAVSYVLEGPIYSYLIVCVPIVGQRDTMGFVAGKRLLDVNYPINNRFINNSAFTSTFASRLDFAPRLDFTSSPVLKRDEHLFSVSLKGLDGVVLGLAYAERPDLSARVEDLHDLVRRVLNLILLAGAVISFAMLYRWKGLGDAASLVVLPASILILRYLLIWINFPAGFIRSNIFEPLLYASPFGSGIAKSIGDLCISSAFLLWTVLVIASSLLKSRQILGEVSTPAKRFLAILTVPLLAAGVCVFIRGFAALIHSAVFDSNLEYNDPTFVLPPVELGVMLVSLLFAAMSLVIGAGGAIALAGRLLESLGSWGGKRYLPRLIAIAVVFLAGILFGALQENGLVTQGERLVYLIGLSIVAVALEWGLSRKPVLWSPQLLVVFAAAGILALVPILDRVIHALDRNRVELLASEIAKPADAWLSLIANQALDELSGPDVGQMLAYGDSDDVEKLAFTKWAKSILSREGYNCSVTYVDRRGEVVSDFHIGIPPHPKRAHRMESMPAARTVHVEERRIEGTMVKWYTAAVPIVSDSGGLLGHLRIELSGGKLSMLRGEAPEFLRSQSRQGFERRNRSLTLSEYFQGKLVATTGENNPLERPLPAEVSPPAASGVWLDEAIDGARYESYYLREQTGSRGDAWLALSMPALDVRWHIYSYLRYVLFYALLGAAGFAIALVARVIRGERFAASFRSKLFAAFLIVSLLPVVILAYYNRQYAAERISELTIKWLSNQTSVVAAEIQRQLGISLPVVLSQLTDERCSEIAGDLNTDFIVYLGTSQQASSKPEMFMAELLDRHLSAESYRNIILDKKNFFAENRVIGKLPYVLGYRPIVAENGSVIGVVSVPTLYRQAEMNQELTRRDVFLYGAYAIALALSLVVGTIFANQISSPVRRLKLATQQIAAGKLDVELPRKSGDELGELEEAFREMVRDLRYAQELMIKAQRELAWREMAKQIAHEIRNPLTPMKLSIQQLRQAYKDGAKDFGNIFQSISETILVQIESLSKIATEFSYFARMPPRKIEMCNVHDILEEAKHLYDQESKITFRSDYTAEMPLVNADREELRRAFINIMRNAVQALVHGGEVYLRTRRSNGSIEIQIADTGPGIPSERQHRLFEPNFSTKTDGMGLGLAIVKKIIDDLGGSISIDSTVGKGTTVTIRLPLVQEIPKLNNSNDSSSKS